MTRRARITLTTLATIALIAGCGNTTRAPETSTSHTVAAATPTRTASTTTNPAPAATRTTAKHAKTHARLRPPAKHTPIATGNHSTTAAAQTLFDPPTPHTPLQACEATYRKYPLTPTQRHTLNRTCAAAANDNPTSLKHATYTTCLQAVTDAVPPVLQHLAATACAKAAREMR